MVYCLLRTSSNLGYNENTQMRATDTIVHLWCDFERDVAVFCSSKCFLLRVFEPHLQCLTRLHCFLVVVVLV